MTTTSTATAGPSVLLRRTPQLVALLVAAAALWAVSLRQAGAMGPMAMGPTMGRSLAGFTAMWATMMAAMMLPSVAPFAAMHARTVQGRRTTRLALFTATYLGVWALTGIPAWGALRLVEANLTSPQAGTVMASGVLVVVGLWQLSPTKGRCLDHCRSPLGHLLHYGSVTGPLRDVRIAADHAVYCLGCCWALMSVFVVTGTMHVGAMVGLTAIVAAEKLTPWGRRLTSASGVLALAAAVAVWWVPGLAPGLT